MKSHRAPEHSCRINGAVESHFLFFVAQVTSERFRLHRKRYAILSFDFFTDDMPLVFDFDQLKNQSQSQLRPREKMAEYGPEALEAWELVAILMRVGVKSGGEKEGVEALSRRLVADFGFRGLFGLVADVGQVKENAGVYVSHAETLVAVGEIARRMAKSQHPFDASTPEKIAEQFPAPERNGPEKFYLLHFGQKPGVCLRWDLVATGGANAVTVRPRDIFFPLLAMGTTEYALVHSHPHSPAPSQADICWTAALKKAGRELFGLKMRDHVIVGKGGTGGVYSFAQGSGDWQ